MLTTSITSQNRRRRYPRSHEERTRSVAPPRPFTNTKNLKSTAETSKTLQKRLRTAALRSSLTPPPRAMSAARRNAAINKAIISARPDRCRPTRPTDTAAATPIQKAKLDISTDKTTDTTSAFIPGKIQIASVDCPMKSTHPDTHKVFLQQQKQQVEIVDIKTSSKSAESVITVTSVAENKEITASVKNYQNKVPVHRFRRKKRQKNRRQNQPE